MPRAFWKGSLSFGLVEIPVALHPAAREDELGMRLLDRKDLAPVGYKRYNKKTGREVPWERTVRAYEYDEDEYVVLTDADLKRANVQSTETIEIVQFVERDEIDPVYFMTPYYVEPLKKASKSYALLRETLRRTDRVGIARVVLRTRQHLCAITVRETALVLELLRYAHEIRSLEGLKLPDTKGAGVTPTEVKVAEQLVGQMASPWKPEKFRDEYREDVLALVKRKVKAGTTLTIDEAEPESRPATKTAEVVDLMQILKQSLSARRDHSAQGASAKRRPAAKAGDRKQA